MNAHKLGLKKNMLVSFIFILLIFSLTSCYSVQSLFRPNIPEGWLGYYLRLETDLEDKDYGTATVLLLKEVQKSYYVIQKITSGGYLNEEYKVNITSVYPNSYGADIQLPSEKYPKDISLSKGDKSLPSYMAELRTPRVVDDSVPYIIIDPSFGDVYFKITGIETPEDIKNFEAAFMANKKAKETEAQERLEQERKDILELVSSSKELLLNLLVNKKMYFIPQNSSFIWNGPELFQSELLSDGETIKFTSLSNHPYATGRIFLLSWESDQDYLASVELLKLLWGKTIDKKTPLPFRPTVDYDLGGQWFMGILEGVTSNFRKVLNMYALESNQSDHTIYLTKDSLSVDLYILLENE